MAEYLQVKDWDRFQHYRHRNPPWIRLYCDLRDNEEFMELTDAQKWHLVACWQDASRDKTMTGLISANEKAFKRKWDINSKTSVFNPLIERGFLSRKQHDSNSPATCGQCATPETETETEVEVEAETETASLALETTPPPKPTIILTFPTIGTPDTWDLTQDLLEEFEKVYGEYLNVRFEMDKALLNVKSKGPKTARGMRKYLTDWLARTNNRQSGRGNGPKSQAPEPGMLIHEEDAYLGETPDA